MNEVTECNSPPTFTAVKESTNAFEDEKKSQLAILINSVARKIFDEAPKTPKPLIPYKIIKYLAENHWDEIQELAIRILFAKDYAEILLKEYKDKKRMWDCGLIVSTLSLIFLGIEKVKKNLKSASYNSTITIEFDLPSGAKWPCVVEGLFDGNTSSAICNDPNFNTLEPKEQIEQSELYQKEYILKFIAMIEEKIDRAKEKCSENNDSQIINDVKKELMNLDYPLNKSTLESFRKDILLRHDKVNNDKSFRLLL